jgi:hypothetical protein
LPTDDPRTGRALLDKGTKGKRRRTVPLIPEIRDLVARRLDAVGRDPMARLFTGPRGGRITTAVVRDATHWDEVVIKLGYKHPRRHDLRHTGYRRLHSLSSGNPDDPGYRRLRYCRYADDTLLGFAGPRAEAEEIKRRLAAFLRDELKLELSPEKTLITHARTERARFLGYEITIASSNRRTLRRSVRTRRNSRTLNGAVVLHVPASVVKAKSAPYLSRGKPECRNPMIKESDRTIVGRFGAEYRGIVQYYLLAGDVHRLHRLRWVMETSMLKTLACKHRSSVSKMAARFKAKILTPHGPRTCFEARVEREGRNPLVVRFGGIPLKRRKSAVLNDRLSTGPIHPAKELIDRLQKGRCELCRQTGDIQVHHVRQLADLDRTGGPQPEWAQVMQARRRKSLVACGNCHDVIHGRRSAPLTQ